MFQNVAKLHDIFDYSYLHWGLLINQQWIKGKILTLQELVSVLVLKDMYNDLDFHFLKSK